jgi:peptidoglycan/xylan/chitin deacetylase (PgdA/CDA1 family)
MEGQEPGTMSFLNSVVGPVLFPSILWNTRESSVHLTFDDGPHPSATPKVLDILGRRGIRATFFLVGENIRQHPALAKEIKSCGHTVGSHSLSHQPLFLKSIGYQRDQIEGANSVFEKILDLSPQFFRPPFGYFDFRTLRVAREAGQKVVMWNLDPHDFDPSRSQTIVQVVLNRVTPGSIVLLHDNERTVTVVSQYLDLMLDRLEQRGSKFSSLPL